MLSVTHLDGRSEPLINVRDCEIEEEVNGAFTLAFASFFRDNPGYELLEEESTVELDGHIYVVKQLKEQNGWKSVTAVHEFFSLIDSPQDETLGGTRTIYELVPFALDGTGWTYEVEAGMAAAFVPNFGRDNRLALIRTLCTAFACEVDIQPNRHLRFAKEIGQDRDSQLRIGHNVKTLSRNVDTTNLVTVGRGKGANELTVEWRSPNIGLYGERYGEIIVDERFTSAENLTEKVKQETQDVPETAIEIELIEIRKAGYDQPVELGDYVWVIDERKGLLIHVRVRKIKTYPLNKQKSPVVEFSNMTETQTDLLTETVIKIDENQKEYRTKIEQTNEYIRLEAERLDGEFVESYAFINLTAENIRLEVGDVENGLRSYIDQTAGQIRLEVTQKDAQLENGIAQNASSITQTASEIRLEVTQEVARLDGAIATNASSITQTASSIRSEVSSEVARLDGRVDTANSSITQLSNEIELNVKSDISSLDGRLDSAESTISVQAGQISSKVSQADYNGNTIASLINQTATTIDIEASRINMDGIVRVNQSLEVGAPGSGQAKSIIMSNYSGIDSWSSTSMSLVAFGNMYLECDTVRFDKYFGGTGAKVDFSTAREIVWGTHAPDTVARFG